MQIEWLRTALKNLDDEAAHIALDSPQAAMDFVAAVRLSVEDLARFPAIGRVGRISGTRDLPMPVYPYLIPYRFRSGRLQILRIFHTRRLVPARW
ncbi:type II toxin-antitoxin system RelE/ParE family toxin [Pseudomonas sp. LP_7_YM]|uniref:type II toxin-antitoxin system RelE/ParE family toxin n=1 Tax=Pseudomonas sp. LP_7_YM TaxID=2485137 RepID=UPI00105CD7A3|nr:type II toxin-antitoxin system RelE/ParE family toxin [Pseudomonas sp. LP_7_YM]